MSKLFSWSLYHTSFLPLWISVLFIDLKSILEKSPYSVTESVSIILILASVCFSSIVIHISLRDYNEGGVFPQTLISVNEEKSITADYLLSYILPLLAFDFTRWDQTVLFLIFYMTLGFLCIRHNYFSVNIMLELSQFKFYYCELVNEDGRQTKQTVITKRQLSECLGETIYLRSVNNEYKLDMSIHPSVSHLAH